MFISKLSGILATSRPAFLVLSPCCLSIAVAFAFVHAETIQPIQLLLILLAGVTAHASVNMFNEYSDFVSGLDFHTQRTPFSGGSGSLPARPELAKLVKLIAFINLLITLLIGLYFLSQRGLDLLPIILIGILLIYFYSDQITHNPWLCLIAPGLAFGPLMVNGAYFVLTGQYNLGVAFASLIVFFLVNNLLLLNQFPDVTADQDVGRQHLPILLGRKKSAYIYVTFLAAAYGILIFSVWQTYLPTFSLLGLLTVFLAIPAANLSVRYANDIAHLKPALLLNVLITLTTPVLVATGIMLD